jgi:hypothetical protein
MPKGWVCALQARWEYRDGVFVCVALMDDDDVFCIREEEKLSSLERYEP